MAFSSVKATEYSRNDAKSFAPSSCSADNTATDKASTENTNCIYYTDIAFAVSVFFFAVLSIIIRRNILLIALPIIILILSEHICEKQKADLLEG